MAILFNFEELGTKKDAVLKQVIALFKKYGARVVKEAVDISAVKRTSGISYREITFVCDDSQKFSLWVKSSGDIFKVKVGGDRPTLKELPIKNQHDHELAIKEIATYLVNNYASFQKRLDKLKVAPPKMPKMTSTVANREKTLTARNAELDALIVDADKRLAELRDE